MASSNCILLAWLATIFFFNINDVGVVARYHLPVRPANGDVFTHLIIPILTPLPPLLNPVQPKWPPIQPKWPPLPPKLSPLPPGPTNPLLPPVRSKVPFPTPTCRHH